MQCEVRNCEGQVVGRVTCASADGESKSACLCSDHADHLWNSMKGLIASGIATFECVPLQENYHDRADSADGAVCAGAVAD
jgi:hypothetical protein